MAFSIHVPEQAITVRPFRRICARDIAIGLLLGLLSFLIYNANLRSITAADTYAARYLPFSIWQNQSLSLNPILATVAQGRKVTTTAQADTAYWILKGRGDSYVSLYPVVVPVVLSPLYLPAVIYLNGTNADQVLLDQVARFMEKLCASFLAATSVGLLYLLLRRRSDAAMAATLTVLYAFGTTTWVISSQALWTHGLAQLLVVAAMLLLTGPATILRTVVAGLLCGLIAANRQPDFILAAGLGIYGLWWAGRAKPLFVLSGLIPVALTLAYNASLVGNIAGAYALGNFGAFKNESMIGGLAGLLISPTRGLFVFSPFLLFIPFFFRQVWAGRSERAFTLIIGCAIGLQVLFYSMLDWRQGMSWGPRWLTDMLPMLMWMLPPVVQKLSRTGRVAFGVASALAISIQAVGAFWYTGIADAPVAYAQGPNKMRPAWEIQNAAFIAELKHPPVQPDLVVDLRGNIDAVNVLAGSESTSGGSGRQIEVLGWALTNNHSPNDVAILIDGRPIAGTREFFSRPDVEKALGQTSSAGWRVTFPADGLAPGEHLVALLVRAREGGEPRLLKQTSVTLAAEEEIQEYVTDLPSAARRARQMLVDHQQAGGYWLTHFTSEPRFEQPRPEMNTYLNAIMLDVTGPVAEAAGLTEMLGRARQFLKAQIEPDGLVRYHGLPDAPTIGTLGCAITPDSDDTALTWRIAPSEKKELLQTALATLARFGRPDGLYHTWLAPRERFECLDPGRDPNPADIGIQMHIYLLLEHVDKPAAHSLCDALKTKQGDSDIWVYYARAPLMVILRLGELERAGCLLQVPPSRLQTNIDGQEVWTEVAKRLEQVMRGQAGSVPAYRDTAQLLRKIAMHDFSLLSRAPPLLYHNDTTGTVSRFYWSQDFGYGLWLRLYFENERLHRSLPAMQTAPSRNAVTGDSNRD